MIEVINLGRINNGNVFGSFREFLFKVSQCFRGYRVLSEDPNDIGFFDRTVHRDLAYPASFIDPKGMQISKVKFFIPGKGSSGEQTKVNSFPRMVVLPLSVTRINFGFITDLGSFYERRKPE